MGNRVGREMGEGQSGREKRGMKREKGEKRSGIYRERRMRNIIDK